MHLTTQSRPSRQISPASSASSSAYASQKNSRSTTPESPETPPTPVDGVSSLFSSRKGSNTSNSSGTSPSGFGRRVSHGLIFLNKVGHALRPSPSQDSLHLTSSKSKVDLHAAYSPPRQLDLQGDKHNFTYHPIPVPSSVRIGNPSIERPQKRPSVRPLRRTSAPRPQSTYIVDIDLTTLVMPDAMGPSKGPPETPQIAEVEGSPVLPSDPHKVSAIRWSIYTDPGNPFAPDPKHDRHVLAALEEDIQAQFQGPAPPIPRMSSKRRRRLGVGLIQPPPSPAFSRHAHKRPPSLHIITSVATKTQPPGSPTSVYTAYSQHRPGSRGTTSTVASRRQQSKSGSSTRYPLTSRHSVHSQSSVRSRASTRSTHTTGGTKKPAKPLPPIPGTPATPFQAASEDIQGAIKSQDPAVPAPLRPAPRPGVNFSLPLTDASSSALNSRPSTREPPKLGRPTLAPTKSSAESIQMLAPTVFGSPDNASKGWRRVAELPTNPAIPSRTAFLSSYYDSLPCGNVTQGPGPAFRKTVRRKKAVDDLVS